MILALSVACMLMYNAYISSLILYPLHALLWLPLSTIVVVKEQVLTFKVMYTTHKS